MRVYSGSGRNGTRLEIVKDGEGDPIDALMECFPGSRNVEPLLGHVAIVVEGPIPNEVLAAYDVQMSQNTAAVDTQHNSEKL